MNNIYIKYYCESCGHKHVEEISKNEIYQDLELTIGNTIEDIPCPYTEEKISRTLEPTNQEEFVMYTDLREKAYEAYLKLVDFENLTMLKSKMENEAKEKTI